MKETSCGIIPLYKSEKIIEVLIVQHNAGHWGFPKGHAEPDETLIETATRELAEETGITSLDVAESISFEEYYEYVFNGEPREKTVTYFPAFVNSKDISVQEEELTDAKWIPLEDADQWLTHDNAKDIAHNVHKWLQTQ